MNEKLKQPYLWLCLLAVCHLPMAVIQYSRLWHYEHYQFFPFALAAFAWLVVTRRRNGFFAWSLTSTALLVIDLMLLVAGYFLNSPWLVCVGAIFLCFSVCLAMRDDEVDSSLAYLVLLPLLTIRLPLSMDTQVIQWLQKATTRVASDFLNHFGYLHLREGNVLEFPGKRFLVEEACSGVQSLFTLLFLAALIVCGYRRKWLHAIFVLISAFCFAGLMNVVRVATVTMAWFSLDTDLSVGWQHDALGYAALVFAALLVFSTDAFLYLVFGPVPDIPGGGVSSMFLNPLTSIWNWLFLVRVGESPVSPQTQNNGDDEGVRSLPGFIELLMPRNMFSWLWNFIESWFLSREFKLLLSSIPFFIVGVGGIAFTLWLQATPDKSLVETYQTAIKEAAGEDDQESQGIYLKNLVRLRPAELEHRFRLALHLLKNEQTDEALAQIQTLTQPGPNDHAPARVWLAQQALAAEPLIPLSMEQIEGQLLAALQLQPRNIAAKQTLADVLLQKGQLKAAETHLLDIVDDSPEVLLPLVKIQKELRRSDEQIQFHLDNAIQFFEQRLMKQPRSVPDRLSLAESLIQAERLNDAERVLMEGLSDSDTPALRSALALFYSQLAVRKFKESPLNRELCSTLVVKSLDLAPENPTVVSQALRLSEMGVPLPPESLASSIELLKNKEVLSPAEQFTLVKALAISQQPDEAIERLEPLVLNEPQLRIIKVNLLKSAGRMEELNSLVETVVADAENSENESNLDASLDAAEVMSFASRFSDSLEVLEDIKEQVDSSPAQMRRWKILFGRATLATYDSKLRAGEFANAKEALDLLNQVLQHGASSNGVLERLVMLSFSDSEFAEPAERALDELLVQGNANAQIYALVGSQALAKDQVSKARTYLERAYQKSRAEPMVLNNLALVLVRDEVTDADRALRLANEALEVVPAHADVLSTRAEVYIALERWEEARADLEACLPSRQDSIGCHTLLAEVWDKLGDSSRANAHRRKVTELLEAAKPAGAASGA